MKKLKSIVLAVAVMCITQNIVYAKNDESNETTAHTLEKFGLGEQITSMAGYNIRARRIIVPAGTKIDAHSHATTPGIVFIESGSIIEYRGDQTRKMHKGDTLVEDVSTVHSYFNDSTEDCVVIAIDLPQDREQK